MQPSPRHGVEDRSLGNSRDFLNTVDPELRKVLTPMFRRLEQLELQAGGIGSVTAPLTAPLDASGQRIHTVADPTAAQDAVNLQTMKKYVDAAIKQQLP